MKKCLLIARSNFRRAKGQTVTIVVLILIASLLLHLWLMLSTDYKSNFDRYHDKLNAEHVTLAIGGDDAGLHNFVAETLDKDARTAGYCMDDVLITFGSFEYNDGELDANFIFLDKETALNRSVGKVEMVEDSEFTSGIYLPMIYGEDSSIAVGKTIDITMGGRVVSYTVCGFFNSVMAGSHNCGMTELVLTDDKYKELEAHDLSARATLVSVRINDRSKSEDFEAALKNAVSSRYPDISTESNSYAVVSSSRYISQMICSGIICAMAFFITLIAVVVIASNVINDIQENMKNLGALKAIGYKSGQIIAALLLQFLSVTLITAVVGIGLSYCLFPAVNSMMVSQTGIPYVMRFLPLPSAITLAFLGGAVALSVWASSRRITSIEPIVALRQGVRTHSFKRNHVPLDRTRAPLHAAFALKTTLSGIKQNVIVSITILLLSLVLVFSGVMLRNVIMDKQQFVDLVVGEMADSCISLNTEMENDFLQMVNADHRVTKVYLYTATEVRHVGGIALSANVSDDFTKVNNQNVCIEGRYPRYDNEVAIAAKYAKENNLKIGDEITLTAEGNEAEYMISGYTQISNDLGKDCLLTRSGYERMGELQNVSYNINIADEGDIDAWNAEVSGRFGNDVNETVNMLSLMNGTGMVYVSLMTMIVIAILILSIFVITFVLYLLVRTMLQRKKRDYGIMKALGYTTGQLVLQTAVSFMPTVILATTVGLVASSFGINSLLAVFLSGIGLVKCMFIVPAGLIAAAGIGLILFAFAMVCLLSLRIRKIAPKELLTGE